MPADVGEHDAVAVACTAEQTLLGEGTRWDAGRGELLRVDILAGRFYRDRVADDGALIPVQAYRLPFTVGAVAPVHGDDGWLLAAGRGFVRLRSDGSMTALAEVAPEGTRMNDAACDPQGRLWAGTLAHDHHQGGGALYRLDQRGRTELVLGDLTISNGLGWSPDGATMYLVDSGPGVVNAFDFDAQRGTLSRLQPIPLGMVRPSSTSSVRPNRSSRYSAPPPAWWSSARVPAQNRPCGSHAPSFIRVDGAATWSMTRWSPSGVTCTNPRPAASICATASTISG